MDVTKRKALMLAATGSVIVMGAGGLPSCSTTPPNVDPKVIDQINQAIASTCSTAVVVAAATIVAIVIAQFPVAAGVAALAPNAAQQIATFICNLIPPVHGGTTPTTPPPVASAKIGGTEIEIHGWHIVNGKAVWF